MARKLQFEQISTTEDTNDPVVRAWFEDSGSHADVIVCQDDELLRVWYVLSNVKGDMKKMIDEIVKQTGITIVDFLEPEALSGKIKDRVNNWERLEETVQTPDGPKKSVYLRTNWNE